MEIRGRVKSIEYFSLSFGAQSGWSNRKPWISEFYNRSGNIRERTVFRDGQISSKVVSFYDERGRNVGNDSFSSELDKTLSVPSRTELILDAAGNAVQLNVYSKGGKEIDLTHTYKYDARGNQIERNYGAAVGKSVTTFDENDNETSAVNSNGSGVVYGKHFTEYNARNQKIKLTIYRDETLGYEIRYKYDGRDRLSEVETREFNVVPNTRTSHAPEAGKLVYAYDDKSKTVNTTKYLPNRTIKPNSTIVFNERGKEIGLSCETDELKTCKTIFEYEFDASDNLIKKICYGRDLSGVALSPAWAEERVISYY